MTFKFFFSLTCASLALAPAASEAAPLDRFLTEQVPSRRAFHADAIVRFRSNVSPADEKRLKSLGGDIYRHLPLIDAVAVRLPRKNLALLARNPRVLSVSGDVAVQKSDEFTVGRSGAVVAWNANAGFGATGLGVGIAILDSGVDTGHPDLAGRVAGRVNFASGDSSFGDLCGHGTHVAGIAAGAGTESSGPTAFRTFYGIAPESQIVSVRVLNRFGQGTVSDTIAGFQWAIANKDVYNIRVLNFSAGHAVGESYRTDPLCQAVEAAWNAGIVVVVAGGNQGRIDNKIKKGRDNEGFGTNWGSIQSPGNDPLAITVGAMKDVGTGRNGDRIATYSSRGPSRYDFVMKPDIVAPGNRVISLNPDSGTSYLANLWGKYNSLPWNAYLTDPTGKKKPSERYFVLSGTSMAAPVVAGAAALLIQKDPSLTPDTIKARLMVTATKWVSPTGQGDVLTYGAGYLDIPAALQATSISLAQPARTPSLSRTADGWVLIDPNDLSMSAAGRNIIWGTAGFTPNIIWGTAGFAPNIIWGTSGYMLSNSRIIWGTSLWTSMTTFPISGSNADLSATAIFGE